MAPFPSQLQGPIPSSACLSSPSPSRPSLATFGSLQRDLPGSSLTRPQCLLRLTSKRQEEGAEKKRGEKREQGGEMNTVHMKKEGMVKERAHEEWKAWIQRSDVQNDDTSEKCGLHQRRPSVEILKIEDSIRIMKRNKNQSSVLSDSMHKFLDIWTFPSLCMTKRLPAAMIMLSLLTGVIIFTLCPQAWAATEVARAEQGASWLGDVGDIKSGFASAFLLIFFSEIGDKTFFIAALLASRKSNIVVFTGTFGALVAMTFISVFLGRAFHYIDGVLPFSLGDNELPLDDLAAVVLLVYFGISTLLEASSLEGSKAEEEQQEAELAIAGVGSDGVGLPAAANMAIATFALVFVAEWGDKSFFSTVALSAASSPLGVIAGAVAGHGLATVLAVLGGSFLASYVSEKIIAYTGGILFLVFAAVTLIEILN